MPAVRGGKNRAVIKGTVKRVRGSVPREVASARESDESMAQASASWCDDYAGIVAALAARMRHNASSAQCSLRPTAASRSGPSTDRALDRCARLDTTERMGNFQIAAAGTLRRAPGGWSPRPPRCSSAVLVVHLQRTIITSGNAVARQEREWARDVSSGTSALEDWGACARFPPSLPCFGLRRTRWITTCTSKRRTGSRSLHGDPRCVRWISTPQSDPMCGRDEMHVRRVLHVPTLRQMPPHGGLPTNPPKQPPTTAIQRPRRRAPELAGSPLQRRSLAPAPFAGKPRDPVVLACRSTAATPVSVHLLAVGTSRRADVPMARSTGVCADADAGRCGP